MPKGVYIRTGKNKHPPNWKDLTGQKFGKWTVLNYEGNSKWRCKCNCRKEKIIQSNALVQGYSKSCGCSKGGKGRGGSVVMDDLKVLKLRLLLRNLKEFLLLKYYARN